MAGTWGKPRGAGTYPEQSRIAAGPRASLSVALDLGHARPLPAPPSPRRSPPSPAAHENSLLPAPPPPAALSSLWWKTGSGWAASRGTVRASCSSSPPLSSPPLPSPPLLAARRVGVEEGGPDRASSTGPGSRAFSRRPPTSPLSGDMAWPFPQGPSRPGREARARRLPDAGALCWRRRLRWETPRVPRVASL